MPPTVRWLLIALLILTVPLAAVTHSAFAQQNNTLEPTRQQLELQISIMQDYIKKLKTDARRDPANAELEKAYVGAKKKEYEYLIAEMDLNIAAYQTARIASNVILALVVLVVVCSQTSTPPTANTTRQVSHPKPASFGLRTESASI